MACHNGTWGLAGVIRLSYLGGPPHVLERFKTFLWRRGDSRMKPLRVGDESGPG